MKIPNNTETSAQLAHAIAQSIHNYADHILPECDTSEYRAALLLMFSEEGSEFLISCMRKFASGQLQYNSNFFTVDHATESRQEDVDKFNYVAGASMVKKYPHLFNIKEGITE